jgi:hypothetical protein
MITRSSKNLLNKGKGAKGTEEPWVLDGIDLKPCDPSNGKTGASAAWLEKDNDLRITDNTASDLYFTFNNGELIPKPI